MDEVNRSWPCSTCGAVGLRNVGTEGFCMAHLVELYRMFGPEAWASSGGIGLPDRVRLGHGVDHDLVCSACAATWVGPMFARCRWCAAVRARMVADRARDVLRPPEVEYDDALFEARMTGWARCLVVAVEAEIVTERAADRAWRRAHGQGPVAS